MAAAGRLRRCGGTVAADVAARRCGEAVRRGGGMETLEIETVLMGAMEHNRGRLR
jgi:hypothetical protein